MTAIGSYFTDPVLQAPTLGSMLMCLASAVIGVVVFLRKRSLLGEALSHAAYPGVVLSAIVCSWLFSLNSEGPVFVILGGAFAFSFIGLLLIDALEKKGRVKSDAALCFVIAFFFGVGVLVASRIQFTHALWYKSVQIFLYGQAATMVGTHMFIYGLFAIAVCLIVVLFFYPIRMLLFDRDFAISVGIKRGWVEALLSALLVSAIVIGIRSVGVVLMAGMLILPAIAARQLTDKLSHLFMCAAGIGAVSGFLGNYLSLQIPLWVQKSFRGDSFSLPTGPMILLSAALLCLMCLLVAPRRGLIARALRIIRFKEQCAEENILKFLWHSERDCGVKEVSVALGFSFFRARFALLRLCRQGWVIRKDKGIRGLSKDGALRAARIVRLHRLWEVYLVFLGQGVEKVHRSAEEMEHIINPELEEKLRELLGNPKRDPHAQPIPSPEETL
jgi:manganese/zinc/iron transport system permease protein